MFISKHSARTLRPKRKTKVEMTILTHTNTFLWDEQTPHTCHRDILLIFPDSTWFKRPVKQTTVFSHARREEHSQMAKVLKPLKGPGLYDADLIAAQVSGTNNKASSGKQAPIFSSNGHHFTVCLGNRLQCFLLTVFISLYFGPHNFKTRTE